MRLTRSARKHGIAADDIRRVLAAPHRSVVQGDVVLDAMRPRPANHGHLR